MPAKKGEQKLFSLICSFNIGYATLYPAAVLHEPLCRLYGRIPFRGEPHLTENYIFQIRLVFGSFKVLSYDIVEDDGDAYPVIALQDYMAFLSYFLSHG